MRDPVSLNEFSRSIELHSIEYYKTCLLKTNQFSTKYILQKLIEHHKKHNKALSAELQSWSEELLDMQLIERYTRRFNEADHVHSIDIEHLNFVEAAALAVRVIRFQIAYYEQIADASSDPGLKENIGWIIRQKLILIEELESEYERLSYKKEENR